MTEILERIDQIAPLASKVDELKEQTIREETVVLDQILERIKPILPLVSYRIQKGYSTSGQQGHEAREDFHAIKGLELVNNFKRIPTDKDYRGEYGGSRLVLFQDGRLVWERRAGEWSQWQGEGASWFIEEDSEFSTEQAVRKYGLQKIISGLEDELKEASRGLEKRQEDYQSRLELVARVKEILG
jgi:hypothetical protein